MDLKFALIAVAFSFLISTVFAYYPYGPEYRIYGTENYLRTGNYPVYYTNYSPVNYSVYSGPYAAYTGYYYEPSYSAYSNYAVSSPYYVGRYWRPYYYRDYPEATTYAVYSSSPTGYVSSYPYSYPSYYNSYSYPSASVSYSSTYYNGYSTCTESWCVRLN